MRSSLASPLLTQGPVSHVRRHKMTALPFYVLLMLSYVYAPPQDILNRCLSELWSLVLILLLFIFVAVTIMVPIVADLPASQKGSFMGSCGFLIYLTVRHAPAHVVPFFASIGTWISAPAQIIIAASRGSFEEFSDEMKPIWRPVLWGAYSYFYLIAVLRLAVPELRAVPSRRMTYTLVCAVVPMALLAFLPSGWLKTF